jgi:putative transposase
LLRDGIEIGRDQAARLMRDLGLQGVRRGRPKRTTIVDITADSTAERAEDLVQRKFAAGAPDRLWVCDLTYIRTWLGFAFRLSQPV